jgi:phage shock protein E
MKMLLRLFLVAVLVPLALAGCSTDTTTSAEAGSARTVQAAEAASLVDDGATVIDVRTPAEFDSGHLAGATNIDVQAADFHDRVGELDREGTYVLYCRSGARAGAAAQMMLDMGFEDVVNAGGFDTLASAGLATE